MRYAKKIHGAVRLLVLTAHSVCWRPSGSNKHALLLQTDEWWCGSARSTERPTICTTHQAHHHYPPPLEQRSLFIVLLLLLPMPAPRLVKPLPQRLWTILHGLDVCDFVSCASIVQTNLYLPHLFCSSELLPLAESVLHYFEAKKHSALTRPAYLANYHGSFRLLPQTRVDYVYLAIPPTVERGGRKNGHMRALMRHLHSSESRVSSALEDVHL